MARVHHARPDHPVGSLVLGHGAGGGIEAPDLQALTALTADGWLVALVEQPWRVAGRRIATPPAQLDTAWVSILQALTTGRGRIPDPLVVGGRSAGARVACRTAQAVGAAAVLALSFPLHPPGRPEKSRADEARLVTAAGLPLAVVQGEKDAFGGPDEVRAALGPAPVVRGVRGTHSFTREPADVVAEVRTWLATLEPTG
jgi:predicted alpha/beta-hydrolase family hydrolase